MEKYLKYKDVMHAVLHNQGQAAVAAIQNLEAVEAIPIEDIRKEKQIYIGSARGYGKTYASLEALRQLLEGQDD